MKNRLDNFGAAFASAGQVRSSEAIVVVAKEHKLKWRQRRHPADASRPAEVIPLSTSLRPPTDGEFDTPGSMKFPLLFPKLAVKEFSILPDMLPLQP